MGSLDSILSGSGDAPAQDQTTDEQVTQTATEGEGQTEQTTEGQSAEGEGGGQRMVPIQALDAQKHKVKRYTEEVSDLRKEIAERDTAWERRIAQLVQAQQPRQEPQAPPDFFDNPQAATRHELTQAVTPEFERINQSLHAFAKDNAITRFTEETVNEAEQAFVTAMNNRTLDPADYQRIASSPNRYAEAVKWHKRQTAQAEIGDDPVAFKAKVEAELREKILAEINGGDGGQAQQRQPTVTPSNLAGARNVGARTGPAWAGPASIDDIFSRRQPG